ncbi:Gfo/Idh/MocA family protein [Sediminibacillus massiliensis]|uniref:Gfo/Idh/MocA family protein n=1 Tax=Sediminibacillus massiliensis TaxID=1926277 RepID=UPI00098849DE|nr:Gfo/Idh/MocA family oxidoreductase [Sediminibacillus massiliensis]
MDKLRWGILSTADIGRQQVIPAIKRSKNGEVTAMASRSQESKQVADELDIPKFYDSYQALLEDPDIDAVYIPLPNSLHKQWVLEAARQKKHILCEKPAALNGEELDEMLAACEENGVRFMEAFMYQFHPQHQRVKELVQNKEIGDISLIRSSFSFVLDDSSNIRMIKDLGGGAMYDVGCYCLHSIRHILEEEPESVYASGKLHDQSGVDTNVAGVLAFSGGVKGIFDCSFQAAPQNYYEVIGTTGSIEVQNAYRPDLNENGEGLLRIKRSNGETEEVAIEGDQYKLQVEHFAEAVLTNQPLSYDKEKMLSHTRIMDAVFTSIDTGEPVLYK